MLIRIPKSALLFALLLPACSSPPAGPSDLQIEFSPKETSRDLIVKPGDTLEIILPTQTGTGYSWTRTTPDDNIVRATSDAHDEMSTYDPNEIKRPTTSDTRVGINEATTFHFQAIATGKSVLEFELRRPWEKQIPAAKRVSVLITVK